MEKWNGIGVLKQSGCIYAIWVCLPKWCVAEGLLKGNPVATIPQPRLEKKLPSCLSEEEVEELMDWVRSYRYYYKFERIRAVAIFAIFLGTGIRKSELMNLKICDVDIEQCSLHVRSGKGKKDRIIPFHSSLAVVLSRYLKERDKLKRQCPNLIVSLRHDCPMGKKAFKTLFDKIRKSSGIYVYPHLLRHTFATIMLQRGLDVREVQELLGHATINSTVVYLSVVVGHLREQVKQHGMKF